MLLSGISQNVCIREVFGGDVFYVQLSYWCVYVFVHILKHFHVKYTKRAVPVQCFRISSEGIHQNWLHVTKHINPLINDHQFFLLRNIIDHFYDIKTVGLIVYY